MTYLLQMSATSLNEETRFCPNMPMTSTDHSPGYSRVWSCEATQSHKDTTPANDIQESGDSSSDNLLSSCCQLSSADETGCNSIATYCKTRPTRSDAASSGGLEAEDPSRTGALTHDDNSSSMLNDSTLSDENSNCCDDENDDDQIYQPTERTQDESLETLTQLLGPPQPFSQQLNVA